MAKRTEVATATTTGLTGKARRDAVQIVLHENPTASSTEVAEAVGIPLADEKARKSFGVFVSQQRAKLGIGRNAGGNDSASEEALVAVRSAYGVAGGSTTGASRRIDGQGFGSPGRHRQVAFNRSRTESRRAMETSCRCGG